MHDNKQLIQDDDYSFPYHYIPQFSTGYSHSYSWPWGLYYVSAMEYVLDNVAHLNPPTVADIGSGDGRLVREMTKILPSARVIAVDYSVRAVLLANSLNPKIDLRCQDIIKESLEEKFDALTLIEVFEHIPLELADSFVSSLRPLIKDNGHLLVTVPHENIPVSAK